MGATKEQIADALSFNAGNAVAQSLAGPLRDLFGTAEGEGYSAEMIELIMELQASFGLSADGKVGTGTRDALARQGYLGVAPCGGIWASDDATLGERRQHYLALYQRFDTRQSPGVPRLLGVRGAYPFARQAHRMIHARRFDDSFVLITDSDAVVFRGATHAYQRSFATSTGSVASIRPGVFTLTLAGSTPPLFNLTLPDGSGNIPAFRDDDHDGVVSDVEIKSALARNAVATEIQFHPGYDTFKKPGEKFSSIGCQTAPLAELELLERAGHTIEYVLANATELASPSSQPAASVS